ncbi:MAG TPA: hypothetical protein VK165_20280 [Azonexus sp.]|nr:hypothetical protein [Azonexus sp.]
MLKAVLYRRKKGPYRMTRVIGARRARIPGMPWFRCFTNRWWSSRTLRPRYILSEATTGFTPTGYNEDDRATAIFYADVRLKNLPRRKILAAIARVHAGHLDRNRIPKRFRARAL